MESFYRPPDAVIRFPAVTLSKEAFEALIGLPVDRFERPQSGVAHYAQINLPDGSSWDDLAALVDRIGLAIKPHLETGKIARPRVDAASYVDDDKASASLRIPCVATSAIGRWGFDLEVSSYVTGPE